MNRSSWFQTKNYASTWEWPLILSLPISMRLDSFTLDRVRYRHFESASLTTTNFNHSSTYSVEADKVVEYVAGARVDLMTIQEINDKPLPDSSAAFYLSLPLWRSQTWKNRIANSSLLFSQFRLASCINFTQSWAKRILKKGLVRLNTRLLWTE